MGKSCTVSLVYNHIPQLTASAQRLASMVVEATAQEAVAIAKRSMGGPKSGRTYRRGAIRRGKGEKRRVVAYRFHRASAPGEAPAIDTATLVNSFFTKKVGPLVRVIGVGAEYAAALEFGTERIAPRPFLRPALNAVRDFFIGSMREIVRQGAMRR